MVVDRQPRAKAIENLEGIIIMALQSRSKNTNFSNLYYDLSTFDYESQKKKDGYIFNDIRYYILHLLTTKSKVDRAKLKAGHEHQLQ